MKRLPTTIGVLLDAALHVRPEPVTMDPERMDLPPGPHMTVEPRAIGRALLAGALGRPRLMAGGTRTEARMIPLFLKAEAKDDAPFIARLRGSGTRHSEHDAPLVRAEPSVVVYDGPNGPIRITGDQPDALDGDVGIVVPHRGIAHRLIRAKSAHNTLLVTEQCDQLCVMCSQPPKPQHIDHFLLFATAVRLAPDGATIGLSGGEPLLQKDALFAFLDAAVRDRPDLSFHVLTNGQHFEVLDARGLARPVWRATLWGIPLYAPDAMTHDAMVAKPGAFTQLLASMNILARADAAIELRTVVTQDNLASLPRLARFVATHLPFVRVWAIMQLENIGYGRKNWDRLFVDSSMGFAAIGAAADIARGRGLDVALYNFPLCTVPAEYRHLTVQSISDWKRRYLTRCDGCRERETCGGFFAWYPEGQGFARTGLTA